MKVCNKTRLSFFDSRENGPNPCTVPQIAMPETINVIAVAPYWPNRRAAHMMNGKTM